jgi:hypothetical protein
MKKLSLAILTGSALFFIGCGSGGGSSSTTSTDSYSTESVMAEPTISNSQEVADAVISNNPTSTSSITSLGLNSAVQNRPNALSVSLNIVSNLKAENLPLNEAASQSVDCTDGGSITINGDYVNGGTILISYDKCKMGDTYINGNIAMDLAGYDANCGYSEIDVKYLTDFTMQSSTLPAVTIKAGSEIDMKYAYDAYCTPTYINAYETSFFDFNNHKYGVEDLNTIMNIADTVTSWYYTKGKIYIDDLTKYVEVDPSYDMSQTPFVYNYYNGYQSGKAVFDMSDGAKTIIEIQNGSVVVGLDKNGDGTPDETTTLY